MPCHHVGNAIVCTGRRRPKRCATCVSIAVFQCDWKLGAGRTCDKHLCAAHALEVATDKHLCGEHQAAWKQWQKQRSAA